MTKSSSQPRHHHQQQRQHLALSPSLYSPDGATNHRGHEPSEFDLFYKDHLPSKKCGWWGWWRRSNRRASKGATTTMIKTSHSFASLLQQRQFDTIETILGQNTIVQNAAWLFPPVKPRSSSSTITTKRKRFFVKKEQKQAALSWSTSNTNTLPNHSNQDKLLQQVGVSLLPPLHSLLLFQPDSWSVVQIMIQTLQSIHRQQHPLLIKDHGGRTPIHIAMGSLCSEYIIQHLIDHLLPLLPGNQKRQHTNTNLFIRDNLLDSCGQSPLHHAVLLATHDIHHPFHTPSTDHDVWATFTDPDLTNMPSRGRSTTGFSSLYHTYVTGCVSGDCQSHRHLSHMSQQYLTDRKLKIITAWIRAFPESVTLRDTWDMAPYDWAVAQHADPAIRYLLNPQKNNKPSSCHRREYTVCNKFLQSSPLEASWANGSGTVTTATNSSGNEEFILLRTIHHHHDYAITSNDASLYSNPVPVEHVQIYQPHFIEDYYDCDVDDDVSSVGTGGVSSFPIPRHQLVVMDGNQISKNPVPRETFEI